ncbi:MAG: hypothetical protein PGN25_01050 [Methylorubrum populi]
MTEPTVSKVTGLPLPWETNPTPSGLALSANPPGGGGETGDLEQEFLKRQILIHNEKTKLTASAANNTAIALFGGGFLLPIVGLSFPLASAPPEGQVTMITMIVWALVAAGLHSWGRTMLDGLR